MEQFPQRKETLREDKIIDATDIEGNKNEMVFEVTKRIDDECSPFPPYIGVFPFGSQTKGYNKETSDLDLYVLREGRSAELDQSLKMIQKEYAAKGVELHVIFRYLNADSLKRIPNRFWDISESLAILTTPGRGPKIDQWREAARESFAGLPSDQREKKYSKIASIMVRNESGSERKIRYRMPDVDTKEYFKKRHELWKHRAEHLYEEGREPE